MNVCFISSALVREREVLQELNKRVNLLYVFPYYPKKRNISKDDVILFCKNNSIEFIINDFSNRRARSLKGAVLDYSLVKQMKKFKPDVIYIETLGSPYLAIFYRWFFGNDNTIIALMDYKLHERSKNKTKVSEKFYRNFQLRFYKYFQFFSYSQKELFKKDYPNKQSYVIRLFLVDKDLHKIQLPKNNTKHVVNFLYFGRIFYYKGIDILIKATNILAQKYNNFKVTIAGSCDLKLWNEEYKPLINNPDNFELKIKYIQKEELIKLYGNADFFLTPYREVTQSGPLLRAYNYNLIPIVSDEKGFTEYVTDGKNGFVFKNEKPESLTESMEKALLLSESDKIQIIKEIKAFKEKEFNIEYVGNKYIEMFDTVINGR